MAPVQEPHRHRPLWQVALVLLAGAGLCLLFLGLGIWQIDRLAWKRELIARVDRQLTAAPVPLETLAGLPPDALEYRRVQVTGAFDHAAETLTKAVTELGGGYWVITPLHTDSGLTVLVNRGFVPPERRDPQTRQTGQRPARVTITGLVRLSEPEGGFLRKNNPQQDQWYSRDVVEIAKARALGPTVDVFVDADADVDEPVGGLTVVTFRNTHLIYALTWFALAALVATGMGIVLRHEQRLRQQTKPGQTR